MAPSFLNRRLGDAAQIIQRHLVLISGVEPDTDFYSMPIEEEISKRRHHLEEKPIEELDLSVRVFNALKRTGLATIGDVLERVEGGEEAMLAIRNFGDKSLSELVTRLYEKDFLSDEMIIALRERSLLAPEEEAEGEANDSAPVSGGEYAGASMRHRKQGKRLGRSSGHRRALQKNLTLALFEHGRITTTLARARFARGDAEKLITLARRALAQDDAGRRVHAQRLAARRLGNDRVAVQRLFDEIAPRFTERPRRLYAHPQARPAPR